MKKYERRYGEDALLAFAGQASADAVYNRMSAWRRDAEAALDKDASVMALHGYTRHPPKPRKLFEYILYRREDQRIDLALAEFGTCAQIASKLFDRSSRSIQLTIAHNRFVSADIKQFKALIFGGKYEFVSGLLRGAFLSRSIAHDIIKRDGRYENLGDSAHETALCSLIHAGRLGEPFGPTELDINRIYPKLAPERAVYELSLTSPVDDRWAGLILGLIKTLPTGKSEGYAFASPKFDTASAIARWSVNVTADNNPSELLKSPEFMLRTKLAELLPSKELEKSDDAALRHVFYRRLEVIPRDAEWQRMLDLDGESFAEICFQKEVFWETYEGVTFLNKIYDAAAEMGIDGYWCLPFHDRLISSKMEFLNRQSETEDNLSNEKMMEWFIYFKDRLDAIESEISQAQGSRKRKLF